MASTLEVVLAAQLQNLQNNTWQVIGETVLGVATASISIPVPSGYTTIKGIWTAASDLAATNATLALLQLNGDTGSTSYIWEQGEVNTTTYTAATSGGTTNAIHIGTMPAANRLSNYGAHGEFTIGAVGAGGFNKAAKGTVSSHVNNTLVYHGDYGGQWLNNAAVTSVQFKPGGGNLVAGSYLTLLGLK